MRTCSRWQRMCSSSGISRLRLRGGRASKSRLRGHFDETFIPLNRARFALVPRGQGRTRVYYPSVQRGETSFSPLLVVARPCERGILFISLSHWSVPFRAGAEVDASPRLAFTLYVIMAKSITVKRKKRGRPATGTEPLYGIRIADAMMKQIMDWAKTNGVTRSVAIRRLVELGLRAKGK